MKEIKTEAGSLSILMGKSGMGKSTISVCDMVSNIKEKKEVVYFSIEYPQSIIYNKLIDHFGLKWKDLFNINIVDGQTYVLEDVVSTIKKIQPEFVYIDYLDLLRKNTYGIDQKATYDERVKYSKMIISVLAALAKELEISIIVLSQEIESSAFEDSVNALNAMSEDVKDKNVIKMFIGRDGVFSKEINCENISHVILVDGYDLKHVSSINVQEIYKYWLLNMEMISTLVHTMTSLKNS